MIELLPLLILLPVVCIATYIDQKTRIIPNWLTRPLIAIGVLSYLVAGVFTHDVWLAILSSAGALCAFAIGYLLWQLRAWGGGDVKLLMGIGAMIPKDFLYFVVAMFVFYLILVLPTHKANSKKKRPFAIFMLMGLIAVLIRGILTW